MTHEFEQRLEALAYELNMTRDQAARALMYPNRLSESYFSKCLDVLMANAEVDDSIRYSGTWAGSVCVVITRRSYGYTIMMNEVESDVARFFARVSRGGQLNA